MKLQLFEDLVNCLHVTIPHFNSIFLFDQRSGHTKKRDDGLSTQNMNMKLGDKVSKMRCLHFFKGCIVCPYAAVFCEEG
jgi:hypothetical protein